MMRVSIGCCLKTYFDKLQELRGENHRKEFNIHVLPEFDPLTVGYRKRWRKLISVPPLRSGLRSHPAPGIILINGQVFGKYLTWPNLALFFNVKDEKLKPIEVILNKFEEMAMLKGMRVFCIKKIDRKELSSKELKPMLDYFYKLRYFMRDGCLCKQLM